MDKQIVQGFIVSLSMLIFSGLLNAQDNIEQIRIVTDESCSRELFGKL